MDEKTAAVLLLDYPKRWDALQERRAQIIDAYGNGNAYHGGGGDSGGHSDNTFKKASLLVNMGTEEANLKVVREWLSIGLNPRDRVVLINLWRGYPSVQLDRHNIDQSESVSQRVKGMVNGLTRFAGRA